jgi:hypothetical protein
VLVMCTIKCVVARRVMPHLPLSYVLTDAPPTMGSPGRGMFRFTPSNIIVRFCLDSVEASSAYTCGRAL